MNRHIDFWKDILERHNGLEYTPEKLQNINPQWYLHTMGNMAGMIGQMFVSELKIIKSK